MWMKSLEVIRDTVNYIWTSVTFAIRNAHKCCNAFWYNHFHYFDVLMNTYDCHYKRHIYIYMRCLFNIHCRVYS